MDYGTGAFYNYLWRVAELTPKRVHDKTLNILVRPDWVCFGALPPQQDLACRASDCPVSCQARQKLV